MKIKRAICGTIALVLILVLGATKADAQISLGVKAGLNMACRPMTRGVDPNYQRGDVLGYFIGPSVLVAPPGVGLGLEASLLFNQTPTNGDDLKNNMKSMAIPLNVRYKFPLLPLFLTAGPQFDFTVDGNDFNYKEIEAAVRDYQDTNISLNIGVGAVVSRFHFTLCYNVPFGRTYELEFSSALEALTNRQFEGAKANSWQLSATYYF